MAKGHWSTWFPGTRAEWDALPIAERDKLSFTATGCTVAYPTWPAPVDCVHGVCRVARGERKPVSLINGALRSERESGWLRFIEDRDKLATIYRTIRAECRRRGTTDIWQCWGLIVYGGIGG